MKHYFVHFSHLLQYLLYFCIEYDCHELLQNISNGYVNNVSNMSIIPKDILNVVCSPGNTDPGRKRSLR
jgi:hypothetical protein